MPMVREEMTSRKDHEGKMIRNRKFNIPCSFLVLLVLAGALLFLAYGEVVAYYNSKYTESAHGNSSSGVRRKAGTSTADYPRGNCAHCHEQHASIEGTSHTPYDFGLFYPNNPTSQDDNFCFQCHKGIGSVQVDGITNYTYSKTFGGGAATFTTIYDALNPSSGGTPSSHNLADVQSHAIGRDIGFTSDNNACVVCHDVHYAQQNYPVTLSGYGGVKTAISRPLDYNGAPRNLWGDDDSTGGYNERMSDYTAKYQAPYYAGGTNYEPANNASSDGSNLPNYRNFCMNNCHTLGSVYSTERNSDLTNLDWGTEGDYHGKDANGLSDSGGWTIAPYTDDDTKNYVLCCTDCHEPHGSTNEWLLRTCVNGKDNISITEPGLWYEFCSACHLVREFGSNHETYVDCSGCHGHSGAYF